jgi:DNA polymerase-3 subunit epsilon
MRQIILDTETTGLNPQSGDRIIEVGCVEMFNRRLTGKVFHEYVNPECEIHPDATAVHGKRWEDLLDKPKFAQIAERLQEFVAGAELVVHNAPFDLGFLNAEFVRLGKTGFLPSTACTALDTLGLAKQLHPGKRNNLNALCERYGISNTHRSLHGALLDARLLADVYLAMTRGQDSLSMGLDVEVANAQAVDLRGLSLPLWQADPEAQMAHEAYLNALDTESKGGCVWRSVRSA